MITMMNASLDNVYAVILAAGASARLGRPKQLLPWRGRPLLGHTLENARSLLDTRVRVVLGARADTIRQALPADAGTIIVNPDWRHGMATSIRAGIEALPASAEAVLLLLCDQPMLGPSQLKKILTGWQAQPDRIVASQYQQTVGVPALFPRVFFEDLKALQQDRGAKSLLLQHQHTLLQIPMPEAEFDIDTPVDYGRLAGAMAPRSDS